MASRSCDLRSSAVGDGGGDSAEDDEASLLPLVDLIFRDTKRGEREAENASLPAINSARRAEKSNNVRTILLLGNKQTSVAKNESWRRAPRGRLTAGRAAACNFAIVTSPT